jgi:catechol 2,3-dioxygenase-like lactoylglutathione lyase family enzyme
LRAAMLTNNKIVAFVPTTNSTRARAFYADILGLRVVREDDFALVLDANGITVRVSKVKELTPFPFTILGWEVSDAVQTAKALRAKGVSFERYSFLEQDDNGIWTAPGGACVAWFKDPDGNVLSITQS